MMTIENIKARAIKIEDQMAVGWPDKPNGKIKLASLITPTTQKLGKFDCWNNIIGFIDKEGMYVIPAIDGVKQALEQNGYTKGRFYIPFTHGDYPVAKKEEWEELLAAAGI